jgi:hypothetical protein
MVDKIIIYRSIYFAGQGDLIHQPSDRAVPKRRAGSYKMYNMNPDLPYNLNFVGLCLIQFASVTTCMPAYRAVRYGDKDIMSTIRKFAKRKDA